LKVDSSAAIVTRKTGCNILLPMSHPLARWSWTGLGESP
jgi:hypothetical protein